ncbi:Mrx19p [Sporobolomyces koalae]|uniref:Mrx19p n=1 Tax=Sporobolomyces koalae TaxID=500713 RepID=UPI0031788DFA
MRSTPACLLKLFALPLGRSTTETPLFLLHASRTRSTLPQTPQAGQGDHPKVDLLTKATDKAADMWSGLGRADAGTWKKRSYDFGEKMMDKIEFEEWALKAIDTNLAPKPFESTAASASKMHEPVELIFPPSLLDSTKLIEQLQSQLRHREPHHRRAMYKCLALSPATIPFGLLPIVPNFPLFYVMWRAWSHWRAHKASSYLLSLLAAPDSNISLSPSSKLDAIYSNVENSTTDSVLLTPEMANELSSQFGFSIEEQKELARAVGQAKERLQQVITEQQDEGVVAKEKKIVQDTITHEIKK